MSFTGSKCCNKDRLQLALAHQWGITTPSNKTDVFGIERERDKVIEKDRRVIISILRVWFGVQHFGSGSGTVV